MSYIRGIAAAIALGFALQSVAHDLVSGDAAGMPLQPAEIPTSEGENFWPLDVSDNGRYVLFANYQLGLPFPNNTTLQPNFEPDADCTIYRKDRTTGTLLAVFESVDQQRYYCNGALMSADGNTVVSAVAAPPGIPAGVTTNGGISFGHVVVAEIFDIDSGSRTDVKRELVVTNAAEIARITLGNGLLALYPAPTVEAVSDDGQLALLSRIPVGSFTILTSYVLADLVAGTAAELLDDPTSPGSQFTVPALKGAALSGDGTTLLVSLDVSIEAGTGQLLPGLDVAIVCGQVGRCDNFFPSDSSLSCQQTPCVIERVERRFYLQDIATRGFTEVAELRLERSSGFTLPQPAPAPRSLSRDGTVIRWLDEPTLPSCPFGLDANNDGQFDCPDLDNLCVDGACELTVSRFNIASGTLVERTTAGTRTLPGSSQTARFSSDDRFLLYPRVVTQPFGADFSLPVLPSGGGIAERYDCISKSSIDSMSGIPVEEPCEPVTVAPGFVSFGYPGTQYNPPVLWGLLNLDTGAQNLLSVHNGNLFQSNYALLSGDGLTVVHHTRDPRLRTEVLTNASLDEELLPDECFWPDGPTLQNLRVATNDNVTYFESDTQYVYEAAPTLCVVPSPVIAGQVFATDLGQRTSSGPRVVRASSFGWLLLPLAGLLMWRRRHGLLRALC